MCFKLPIECIEHKEITETIQNDLDMTYCYKKILGDTELLSNWCGSYTTNKTFLIDTQQILKNINIDTYDHFNWDTKYEVFKSETNFKEKYQYLNIDMLSSFNESTMFMQSLSIYNISAPIFSLFTPIFIFIVPFFILRLKRINISGNQYAELLKDMMKKTNVYKFFYENTNMTYQQKSTLIMSIVFYIFQIYQNIISCIQFYKNIHIISDFMDSTKELCDKTITQIKQMNVALKPYKSYEYFLKKNNDQKEVLESILQKISFIFPYKNTLCRLSQIGYIMTLYYSLFYDKKYNEAFVYSRSLNVYVKDMNVFKKIHAKKKLNCCVFDKDKTYMKSSFYLANIQDKPVKNNITIDKHIMITGPNASGKTTLIKSVLLNFILSQQLGMGCYKKANIHIYDHFHSYLNIPDTSGRDSLFQAEARRCKDILNVIEQKKNDRHFCIFDELYSGTNPNDAVLCAEIYLKGLTQYTNVEFLLTTHYITLCENINKKNSLIKNIKMNVVEHKDKLEYTYKIKKGISYIHGGKQVLKDLDYPEQLFV